MPYSAPASKATGDLISAADWNLNTITNPAYLKGRLDYGYIQITNWRPNVTGGAAGGGQIETTSDFINISTIDFDASSGEYVCAQIVLPADYDGGTFTYKVYYTNSTSTDDDCIWSLRGVSFGDGDSLDSPYGVGISVTKSPGTYTANLLHITSESEALTVAGNPAPGDLCIFRLSRTAADGGDTLNVDARHIATLIKYGRA